MRKRRRSKRMQFLSLLMYTIFLHSNFSKFEVYINNQQIYNPNGLYEHRFFIFNDFKWPSLKTREFCTARGFTMKNSLMKLSERPCLNFFLQREGKSLTQPMVSCCMVNLGLTFFPLLNCYIQI